MFRTTPKPNSVEEAQRKMERFCAYQERCHQEVLEKLRSLGMIPEAIDQIMANLIKENYLNEERFAKSFARGKFRIKKWGRNRIVQELKNRKISTYNIKSALSEIDQKDYLGTLDELALKRLSQIMEPNLQKRRKKLADYLLYRGWESDLVYGKIKELT
ncbi:regulatory protein RecX [Flagellimonas meishanensis]|uniref:regulatory protein RecX n=1 Tax=Flagellimonas meishanensis TaxID=2873264 RepID=UPI00223BD4D4|nr:regulatory protein RecX [[Muricauda] meishanensis]